MTARKDGEFHFKQSNTMKKQYIEQYISSLTGKKIKFLLLKNQLAKKSYEKCYIYFESDEILENTIYGIKVDDMIEFEIKVANIDNIFKTLINSYVSKVMMKEYQSCKEKGVVFWTKQQCFDHLKIKGKGLRMEKYFLYTTIYGFGIFSLFYDEKRLAEMVQPFKDYLEKKNISYKNEYSDAMWVFRFVTKLGVENHNLLLAAF